VTVSARRRGTATHRAAGALHPQLAPDQAIMGIDLADMKLPGVRASASVAAHSVAETSPTPVLGDQLGTTRPER
jgi:hypothetical protein